MLTERPSKRQRVVWLDVTPDPAAASAFRARGFLPDSCTNVELQDPRFQSGVAAVVFEQPNSSKPHRIAREVRDLAPSLLDHGCHVVVRPRGSAHYIASVILSGDLPVAGAPASTRAAGGSLPGLPPLPHIRIFEDLVPWDMVANFVFAYPLGDPPDPTVKINFLGAQARIEVDDELLVRRAFSNCSEVHLSPLDDGRSGAGVYRALVERGGLLGRWSQPYFVKLGPREKIYEEYKNYESRVAPYVPFHLGPRLDQDRCCLGARRGILVGDFVDEAESLLDSAERGRGSAAIACLFDRTLRGWHRDAKLDPRPLSTMLKLPKAIPSGRLAQAARLGSKYDLEHLAVLFGSSTSTPVLVGWTHGDLHGDNVLVRAHDAIVIDFCTTGERPVVSDAAALEASLLISGFRRDMRDADSWFKSVEMLYDARALSAPSPHPDPRDPSAWFHNSVRQIRMYARQSIHNPNDYALALAQALLVKASKDPIAPEPESSRRAAAYLFAERILTNVTSEASPYV